MIISIDWLRKFVDIKEDPEELAELLSNVGLEAEPTNMPLSLPGVIIAKVESTKDHPNADSLKICEVNDGIKVHQVICGAPNVAKGQIVAFATIGTTLPGNLKIKKASIRGEGSFGMICSEKELQISDEHEGIMVLPENLILGEDFSSAYGYKFLSIELDITPNRPDAFSHLGVARDIAAATKRQLMYENIETVNSKIEFDLNIKLENSEDCPRYVGGIFKNIRLGESPRWLVDYMKSIGEKSINNLVDISNYILFELGHPTHIFDLDKLATRDITVRRALPGEGIVTLDEKEHELNKNNLLITSGNEPIALAGIIGGLSTSVTENTKTILVESAYFNPVTIRKSAKSLFLSTEASKRYERGVDPNGCIKAFSHVASLICDITGGELVSDIVDKYPNIITSKTVSLRRSEIDLVLGYHFNDKIINEILEKLEFKYTFKDNTWECVIPTFRPDIEREIDIIEEIARIAGFNAIPSDENIYGTFKYQHPDPDNILNKIRDSLSSSGFHQIYSNSLQSKNESSMLGYNSIPMLNPLNIEMGFLRTSLLPGLLKACHFNIKNGAKSLRLYELGNVHHSFGDGLDRIKELQYLSGIIYGNRFESSVHFDSVSESIYEVKGILSFLFHSRLNMNIRYDQIEDYAMDQAQSVIVNNLKIGNYGRVSEKFKKDLGVDSSEKFYAFEINLQLIKKMMNNKKVYKKINLYPTIERDLNFVLKKEQEVGELLEVIRKLGRQMVIEAKPKNIYSNSDDIGAEFKSVTFSIVFQHSSKTLEDSDVNPIIDEIVNFAEKKFHAKLRV
tara:strand:+ start:1171 stop:3549 length:2379 start_codon:yes stop_codon:yes gene_type:complete